jgi:uncharacterized HAD superfamily protein
VNEGSGSALHSHANRGNRRPRIGVDVDGVLADQISNVLPLVAERHGVDLSYEDITDWQLPIGSSSDIKEEILRALADEAYVVAMPVHLGARNFLDALSAVSEVTIVTARPNDARHATLEWLARNRLTYDHFINSKESEKGLHGTDVLVDDFLGNVAQFLQTTNGHAVLVDQPWNRKRTSVDHWIKAGRLFVVDGLDEALLVIRSLIEGAKVGHEETPCGSSEE